MSSDGNESSHRLTLYAAKGIFAPARVCDTGLLLPHQSSRGSSGLMNLQNAGVFVLYHSRTPQKADIVHANLDERREILAASHRSNHAFLQQEDTGGPYFCCFGLFQRTVCEPPGQLLRKRQGRRCRSWRYHHAVEKSVCSWQCCRAESRGNRRRSCTWATDVERLSTRNQTHPHHHILGSICLLSCFRQHHHLDRHSTHHRSVSTKRWEAYECGTNIVFQLSLYCPPLT